MVFAGRIGRFGRVVRPFLCAEDATLLIAVVVGLLTVAQFVQDFSFIDAGGLRWRATLISLTPGVLLYAILRTVGARVTAALATIAVTLLLSAANRDKVAFTGEPLVWSDLTALDSYRLVLEYAGVRHMPLLVLGAFAGLLAARTLSRAQLPSWPVARRLHAALAMLVAPAALLPYLDLVSPRIHTKLVSWVAAGGLWYKAWDGLYNSRSNGLLVHLVQSSRFADPPEPTAAERASYDRASRLGGTAGARPRTVVVVLCESCWNDSAHFTGLFDSLRSRGFASFRAVSPVFGGLTVNATFELLSGLPANHTLPGVILQEYASRMSDTVAALPAALRRLGYQTSELHNYRRTFWRRHIVSPKLGFNSFLSLEDMQHDGGKGWPDDSVVFKAALRELNRTGTGPKFLFITTVHTHGGYGERGVGDTLDFLIRMRRTVARIADFADSLSVIDPTALIVVAGDHKPALLPYFVQSGVFSRSDLLSVGERSGDFVLSPEAPEERIGDVPVLVRSADTLRLPTFISRSAHRPFYCVAMALDDVYLSSGLPTFAFVREACERVDEEGVRLARKRVPAWIYSMAILH